jgi:5'-nucleotidase
MHLPSRGTRAGLAGLVGLALAATPLVVAPASAADPVKINLLNINDFHGRIDSNTVQFASTVQKLKKDAANGGEANSVFLSAGDNIGASVYASASQQDKPTLDVLNALGLETSAVGNHEFDQGYSDLTGRVADVANWNYLGANVYSKGTTTVAPGISEYALIEKAGLTIGVIGAITQETPSLVSPAGISTLDFGDPVDAVNRVAAQLTDGSDANGEADVIVAEYHEGAGAGTPDGASLQQEISAGGAFAKIVTQTSASVDAIFTGHTHKQYAWDGPIPGVSGKTRPVLQTGSYGENIGQIVLTVDSANGDVQSYTQKNNARPAGTSALDTAAIAADGGESSPVGQVAAITKAAVAKAAETGSVKVGSVTADITTAYTANGTVRDDRASESTLGNLVADSLVASLSPADRGGAEIGIVNPGGLRAELLKGDDGVITYAEANAVLPFANGLFTETITGSQFKTVLEQQWQTNADGSIPSRPYLQLGLSKNVSYTYDPNAARGSHITSIYINGSPIDLTKNYRIGTFSFLTSGGDNFRELAKGTNLKDSALVDRDAWVSYITANSPLSPSFARRAVAVANAPTGIVKQGTTGTVELAKLDLTSLGSPANTSVTATFEGSKAKGVTTPVTAGAAKVTFKVPYDTPANATLVLTASPSKTVVRIPITTSWAIDSNEPKISGDNKVGSTLKARVGTWDPRPVSMSYRWYLNGKAIKGATSKSLKLTKSMIGDKITFRAVGKKAGYPTEIRYSDAVKVYRAFSKTPRPTISGTPKAGHTVKAVAHRWSPSASHKYQWYRNGVAIKGADEKAYKLTSSDKGKKITVKVWGIRKGYLTETETRSIAKVK